jgi:hypothetical protein
VVNAGKKEEKQMINKRKKINGEELKNNKNGHRI